MYLYNSHKYPRRNLPYQHDDIGVLFKQLTYHAVHVERFTTSAWADTKEIGVVRHLDLAFLTGDVDTDGKSLTVGIVGCQRCIF